jgi:hypothetical protein
MYKNYVFLLLAFLTNFAYSQVTTVIDNLNTTGSNRLLIHNDILYYSTEIEIFYFNINDTNPIPTLLIDNLNNPTGMAIKDGFLYVAIFDDGDIIKLDLSVTNPSPIDVTFFGQTPNMLEFEGNNLYYTDNNGKRIYRKDITNSSTSAENFLNTTPTGPIGLAIKDNFIYYNLPAAGTIYKLGLNDPQGTPILVLAGLNRPLGMEFKDDELYIADRDNNSIVKINITGSSPSLETVITNFNAPDDIAFDGDDLYIINSDEIAKIDLSLSVNDYTLNDLKLYPNPTTDYLKVSNLSASLKYDIKDLNGRSLQNGTLNPNEQIDTTSLASGTYFITFHGETSVTKKFLKQ